MVAHLIRRQGEPRILHVLRITGLVILGAAGAVFFAFLFGYFVMFLWNWLMPAIFGITTITFWQAVAIIILARLIFGGFKHGHDFHNHKYSQWKKSKCKPHPFTKWQYYDTFWKEEGEQAFIEYVKNREAKQE
ncbi:MAG: hypothetical protein JXJ22_05805 [Bacteroidales bacterium]|nr:hypothetical protein [Bacteroidales bacterium]